MAEQIWTDYDDFKIHLFATDPKAEWSRTVLIKSPLEKFQEAFHRSKVNRLEQDHIIAQEDVLGTFDVIKISDLSEQEIGEGSFVDTDGRTWWVFHPNDIEIQIFNDFDDYLEFTRGH